jgi:alpha-1,3-rhamnosyl/mannosyltransferase
MRIGLDARYIYDHFPGIGRYTLSLARALAALDRRHTLVLLHNPDLPNTRYDLAPLLSGPNVELVATAARPFSLAEQVQVPRLVRRLRLDVLHFPYYIKPYWRLPCPTVLTVYDLIGRRYPGVLSWQGRRLFALAMRLAVRSSQRIVTISSASRDDIAYYYGIPRDQITVTPLATDERFSPQSPEEIWRVRRRYGLPTRYVLYLGSNKPHKNLERLVRAWERFVQDRGDQYALPHLVIAGHYDPRYPEARRLVETRGLRKTVHFVPDVVEADVPGLYSGADVFVFPSYYEGFGLPPLEAMACGVPVLCAHASSLPEVVGDAALTFDPHNPIELAAELRRLLDTPALRQYFRVRGIERARAFSWHQTARATLDVYTELNGSTR